MKTEPGILALWNDCAPEGEADYERWYMAEHLPERVGVPGFRFGRRYERLVGDRKYFTYYETESPEVLWSAPYVERLQDPTAWTRRVMTSFRNMNRTVCRRAGLQGAAQGGHVVTFRVDGAGPADESLAGSLRDGVLSDLMSRDGICGAQLWMATDRQTPEQTSEAQLREADEMISWALVVETTFEAQALALAGDEGVFVVLRGLAPSGGIVVGAYRLICALDRRNMVSDDGT